MAHLEVASHLQGLEALGLYGVSNVYHNLESATLIEHAIRRGEGELALNGALVVRTGKFTGRSPKYNYIVQEPSSQENIWWGPVNQPLSEDAFERLFWRITNYLRNKDVYVQDLYGGADSRC